MRNRAKCKQCQDVIESFHADDLVFCRCKEIAISGGFDYYWCRAKDYKNFLRVDDEDNEIPVKYVDRATVNEEKVADQVADASKVIDLPVDNHNMVDHLGEITDMIRIIEELPNHAKQAPCTQYDFLGLLYVMQSWMKNKNNPS